MQLYVQNVSGEQVLAPDTAAAVWVRRLTVDETIDFQTSVPDMNHDLDKFTRFFIQKSIQVIVQSRLGGDRVQTECNAHGHDWFNLSIPDDREVTDRTRKCFDAIAADSDDQKLSVSSGWQVCCEVSLKNSDGESMVLEYWLFSNESLLPSHRGKVSVASSDVFTVYNRLTLLLKSIIALTRATPIHKISNSGQGPDTFVICYRVFATDGPIDHLIQEKDKNRYARVIKLGTVSSPCSRIAVSFSYRTNMATCNDDKSQMTAHLMPLKMDHFRTESPDDPVADFSSSRKILAFASPKKCHIDASILVPENAFLSLLPQKQVTPPALDKGKEREAVPLQATEAEKKQSAADAAVRGKEQKSGSGSRVSASDESFVFVEAPFASSEEKVLGSFFNGPSPGFLDSEKLPLQLNELTAEIEALESSVNQWDSFVESVCSDDCSESTPTPTNF